MYQVWKRLRYTFLTLDEQVVNLLRQLRMNYCVGLITNGPSRSQWEKIFHLDAKELFDIILVSGDHPYEKPEAEIFHMACRQMRVSPSRSVMIGDRIETDILGGKLAGLAATIWIPLNASDANGKAEQADYTIFSILDLAPMFGVVL